MVDREYIPDRGDLIWLDFDPQAGREQRGRRPAVVLSAAAYNGRVGLALLCPVTSKVKGYPFEVELPQNIAIQGVALADQVKSLDWRLRRAERIEILPTETTDVILARTKALLA